MRLTEKEASKKVCPFMTYCSNPDQANYQRFPIMTQEWCQGSYCMAWAWHDKSMRRSLQTQHSPAEGWVFDDEEQAWFEPEAEWMLRQVGYCRRLYEK